MIIWICRLYITATRGHTVDSRKIRARMWPDLTFWVYEGLHWSSERSWGGTRRQNPPRLKPRLLSGLDTEKNSQQRSVQMWWKNLSGSLEFTNSHVKQLITKLKCKNDSCRIIVCFFISSSRGALTSSSGETTDVSVWFYTDLINKMLNNELNDDWRGSVASTGVSCRRYTFKVWWDLGWNAALRHFSYDRRYPT